MKATVLLFAMMPSVMLPDREVLSFKFVDGIVKREAIC